MEHKAISAQATLVLVVWLRYGQEKRLGIAQGIKQKKMDRTPTILLKGSRGCSSDGLRNHESTHQRHTPCVTPVQKTRRIQDK